MRPAGAEAFRRTGAGMEKTDALRPFSSQVSQIIANLYALRKKQLTTDSDIYNPFPIWYSKAEGQGSRRRFPCLFNLFGNTEKRRFGKG